MKKEEAKKILQGIDMEPIVIEAAIRGAEDQNRLSTPEQNNWKEELEKLIENDWQKMDGGVIFDVKIELFISSVLSSQAHALKEQMKATLKARIEEEEYDNMVCSKCKSFVRERFSHHSEDGFSECCGKKLERVQGTKVADTNRNILLIELLSAIESIEI